MNVGKSPSFDFDRKSLVSIFSEDVNELQKLLPEMDISVWSDFK